MAGRMNKATRTVLPAMARAATQPPPTTGPSPSGRRGAPGRVHSREAGQDLQIAADQAGFGLG